MVMGECLPFGHVGLHTLAGNCGTSLLLPAEQG